MLLLDRILPRRKMWIYLTGVSFARDLAWKRSAWHLSAGSFNPHLVGLCPHLLWITQSLSEFLSCFNVRKLKILQKVEVCFQQLCFCVLFVLVLLRELKLFFISRFCRQFPILVSQLPSGYFFIYLFFKSKKWSPNAQLFNLCNTRELLDSGSQPKKFSLIC